jgi:hypothetical protein
VGSLLTDRVLPFKDRQFPGSSTIPVHVPALLPPVNLGTATVPVVLTGMIPPFASTEPAPFAAEATVAQARSRTTQQIRIFRPFNMCVFICFASVLFMVRPQQNQIQTGFAPLAQNTLFTK